MRFDVNIFKVRAIAKKEFMDNLRNRWVLALSMIFLLLTIIMSYFGGAQTGGDVEFHGFEATVSMMSSIAGMLLPIIAIMLGYASVIGERENGSMQVVLGCPVSRNDVILGKFAGLGLVMLVTIFLGFGISGLIVGALAGFAGAFEYFLFMILTFVFSMFFLGFSLLMSTIANKRSTAIAGGLVVFFSGMIAGVVLMGLWVASGGDLMGMVDPNTGAITMPEFPDWVWAGEYFSFMDIYGMAGMDLFGTTDFMGFDMDYPWFVNAPMIFAWFLFLTAATFLGSIFIFNRKDM